MRWHYNDLQETINQNIVRGTIGIDIGSGSGNDTYIMAMNNPLVKLTSLDISEGVFKTKKRTSSLKNVSIVKGSTLQLPFKNDIFDFAYSYGVIHHVPNPERGIKEIARVLKSNAPIFLYLYEDHHDDHFKKNSLRIVSILRKITTRIHPRILYILCFISSPVVVFVYFISVLFLKSISKRAHEKIPFNYCSHPFSLTGDLFDRFGAPIERRFSKKEAYDLLSKNGFKNISVDKLKTKSGLIVWGFKDNDKK